MFNIRYILLVLLLPLAAACASDPLQLDGSPVAAASSAHFQVAVGETFRLRRGEVASLANGDLLVAFREIRQDSRCPEDVTCVWAGDAEASIGVAREGGRWTWISLHTGVEPRSARTLGHSVTLLGVEPATWSQIEIPPDRYTVLLRISPD